MFKKDPSVKSVVDAVHAPVRKEITKLLQKQITKLLPYSMRLLKNLCYGKERDKKEHVKFGKDVITE